MPDLDNGQSAGILASGLCAESLVLLESGRRTLGLCRGGWARPRFCLPQNAWIQANPDRRPPHSGVTPEGADSRPHANVQQKTFPPVLLGSTPPPFGVLTGVLVPEVADDS